MRDTGIAIAVAGRKRKRSDWKKTGGVLKADYDEGNPYRLGSTLSTIYIYISNCRIRRRRKKKESETAVIMSRESEWEGSVKGLVDANK